MPLNEDIFGGNSKPRRDRGGAGLTNPLPLHSINLRVPCYLAQVVGTINASMVSRCNSGTNDADGANETTTGKGSSVDVPLFRGFEWPAASQSRGELFTAFSYTGSPKTDQGGDNQARHVVSKLMNPELAC